jgi:hypothetical protein
MRIVIAMCLAILVGATTAAAQPSQRRLYVGAVAATEAGDRGPVSSGAIASAGGVLGISVSESFAVEFEIERGFREARSVTEAVWISYPTSPNPTREEIERFGIRARFDRTEKTGPGFSALVLWRTREPGRVNAALFGGVSARHFEKRTIRTHISASPELNLPPTHPNLQTANDHRDMTAGGITGGLMVLVRTTRWLTVAPELRVTTGLITDDPFRIVRAGVRLLWGY